MYISYTPMGLYNTNKYLQITFIYYFYYIDYLKINMIEDELESFKIAAHLFF